MSYIRLRLAVRPKQLLASVAVLVSSVGANGQEPIALYDQRYGLTEVVEHQVLVGVSADDSFDDLLSPMADELGFEARRIGSTNVYRFVSAPGDERSPLELMESIDDFVDSNFERYGQYVLFMEPNYVYRGQAAAESEDPLQDEQWNLDRIEVEKAWSALPDSQVLENLGSIVVAVIDSGVYPEHEDLESALWHYPIGEDEYIELEIGDLGTATCYQADVGLDLLASPITCTPFDANFGHGTAVAGVLGAAGDNGLGISGVAPGVRILPVRVLNDNNWVDAATAAAAVDAVVDLKSMFADEENGAGNIRIINASWGGHGFSVTLWASVVRAAEEDILFVAASGNETSPSDEVPFFPANFGIQNVIAVAATTDGQVAWDGGKLGAITVDVGAPGKDVWTTYKYLSGAMWPGYQALYGTSMAAPHVSGVAALVLAACSPFGSTSEIDVFGLRDAILQPVRPMGSLEGKVITGGEVNACRAVHACLSALSGVTPCDEN